VVARPDGSAGPTLDGSDGSSRDHTNAMFPTLAIRTPWAVTPKPLRVRQIEARLSLRDRNRGCPTRGPLRLPEIESNQLR